MGLRYKPGAAWALKDVSFTIPLGSCAALVGPNGAGKSTLIRACLGFEKPDEGRAVICGHDPQYQRTAALSSVGYVPQLNSLYRSLTIDDHITIAKSARRDFDADCARQRVLAVGLQPKQSVGQLSGGERAQVALALALGTRAPLLLLDEPLAQLDPLARRDFLAVLIDHVRSRGGTTVLSSHIVTDIEFACDRLLVMASGRLVLDTQISVAYSTFRTVPVGQLLGRAPIGTFAASSGMRALIADRALGSPASLEEIVLGHLAAGRLTEV